MSTKTSSIAPPILIYQGRLWKKGRYTNSYKQYYFRLYNDNILKWYDGNYKQLDLSTVTNITQDNDTTQFGFILCTKDRRYFLRCDNESDYNIWLTKLGSMVNGNADHENADDLKQQRRNAHYEPKLLIATQTSSRSTSQGLHVYCITLSAG